MSISTRLKSLETAAGDITEYTDVLRLIRQSKYYDELTDGQKDRYTQYRYGTGKDEYEFFTLLFSFVNAPYGFMHTPEDIKESGVFHFQLEYVPKEPTASEHAQHIQEIADFLQSEETPEAMAQHKAQYKELCRINDLRRAAVARGEDPNQYPAPWQSEYETKKHLYQD